MAIMVKKKFIQRRKLSHAIQKRDVDTIRMLIRANRQVLDMPLDASMNTPLMKAVSVNDESIVKILLQAGADVNARDRRHRTPLMMAKTQIQTLLMKTPKRCWVMR